ncbi:hypothetical protein H2200_006006 [Cladophialophora chaetospira]|uniref:Uncharacterized protein n=1 Tax=Cladophialophora chaetospira TaxID=386627 RepID=A0AA38XAT0_9EURO|nr:hypothetical protein H2200_006006 [Cladophialophora chaetospira]
MDRVHPRQEDSSTIPDQIYGYAAGNVSEIFRNRTMRIVATSEIALLLMLLVLESQVTSFQPTSKDRQISILTRRTVIYKLMNERLTDSRSSLADDYILAVAIAEGSEHRMDNTQNARCHIIAAKRLLELRGGLRSIREIAYPWGLMIVNIFVEQGVDDLDVQAWHFTLKYGSSTTQHGHGNLHTHKSHLDRDQPVPINDGHSTHDQAFEVNIALYDYVHLPGDELEDAHFRFYLSILYAMNTALYAFRESEVTTGIYLKGVRTAVEKSTHQNFLLRAGGFKLPSLVLLLMIAHSAVEAGERNPSTSIVFNVEEVLEFVEIMMMASRASRMNMLRALESWLTTPIATNRDLIFVNNAKLKILAKEVEEAWRVRNSREADRHGI